VFRAVVSHNTFAGRAARNWIADQDNPAVMNLAMNNAENMRKFYQGKGETIEIEFVAFGGGLAMMRSDKSPVKERLAAMSHLQGVKFSGCDNTVSNQSKAENKTLTLLPETHLVPRALRASPSLRKRAGPICAPDYSTNLTWGGEITSHPHRVALLPCAAVLIF
jgi:uncharacterized protein